MADIALEWADDINFDDLDDVEAVDGPSELRQRLIRGFLSSSAQAPSAQYPLGSPGDDPFDGEYGADARRDIDSVQTPETLQGIRNRFLQVIANEGNVSSIVPPVVTITQYPSTGQVFADVQVTQANGEVVSIPAFQVST